MSRDKDFLEWFNNKDFFFIENMKPERKPEYYCRVAWFARDEEIEKLKNGKVNDTLPCPFCGSNKTSITTSISCDDCTSTWKRSYL